MKPQLQRLRTLGFIEGTSFLLLVFIAMPLKYLADMPMAVRYVGSIHGALFVFYVILATVVFSEAKDSAKKFFLAVVVASVPFGPFIFDKKLFPQQGA